MASRAGFEFNFAAADIAIGFISGALSVLVFQMGLGAILHAAGISPNAPYSMTPVPPFGVPQSLSGAFWGGLWGIVLLAVLRAAGSGVRYWLTAILFGGLVVGGTLLFVVLPLKGRPFAAGWNMTAWALILCSHAMFGFGAAVFIRVFGALRRPGQTAV
jgi:hypothetical protein